MIKKPILAFPIFGLVVALLLPASASAGALQLNFSLTDPAPYGDPGGPVVSFTATVSAPLSNSGDVFLNSDSSSMDFPLTLDDTPFFNITPMVLSPGQSFTGEFFDVTVPGFAAGSTIYNGFFEIDGGADLNTFDPLASVSFTVTTTPEPGTVILLLSGFSVLAAALRRRQCRQ